MMEFKNLHNEYYRCPCYEGHEDFHKVIEIKETGIAIYRPTKFAGNDKIQNAKCTSGDMFILHNTTNAEVLPADVLPAFDKFEISCPRCRYTFQNAKSILKQIPKIDKNDIIGICDHCRAQLARTPCSTCNEIVTRFISSKTQKKTLSSEFHRLWKYVTLGVERRFKQKTYSEYGPYKNDTFPDINTQNLYYYSPNSVRNPKIDEFLNSKTSLKPKEVGDLYYYSYPELPIQKKTVIFDFKTTKRHLLNGPNKEITSRSLPDLFFNYIDDNKSLDTFSLDFDVARRVSVADDVIDIKRLLKKSMLPIKKHASEDSLFTSISQIISEKLKEFGYFFPVKVDNIIATKQVSSSELIKSTEDRLQKAEEKKRKNEETGESMRKKLEDDEKGKTAKDEINIEQEKTVVKEKTLENEIKKEIIAHEKKLTSEKETKDPIDKEIGRKENLKKEIHKQKGDQSNMDSGDVKEKLVKENQFKSKEIKTKAEGTGAHKNLNKDNNKHTNKTDEADLEIKSNDLDKKSRTETKSKEQKIIKPKQGSAGTNKEKFEIKQRTNESKKIDHTNKDKTKLVKDTNNANIPKESDKVAKVPLGSEPRVNAEGELRKLHAEQQGERQLDKKLKHEERDKELIEKKNNIEKNAKKPISKLDTSKPTSENKEDKSKELGIHQIKMKKDSTDDLILQLVKLSKTPKQVQRTSLNKVENVTVKRLLQKHKQNKSNKGAGITCTQSDLELDLESLQRAQQPTGEKLEEIIIGPKIFKYKTPMSCPWEEEPDRPALYNSAIEEDLTTEMDQSSKVPASFDEIQNKSVPQTSKALKTGDQEVPKGIIRYALSDRSFIDKGWTMLPTEKVVRKMNVYRMRPAHPEFDWFEHNKRKRYIQYESGEKLAEFNDNGRGRWFYKNGRLALDYYDAEEINAQQRFVIYSNGEPDERGRTRPNTILATFDYIGNGVVFDHAGKIRLKYNQTEGVVLDRSIGPVSHWKWHSLNDPPVLQQVMIDTQMPHKDPEILKLGGPGDNKTRPDNEEMLAIEFDNFIKEKSKKLTQTFKPFQIKMKALKINEQFSLRVMDQANIYLIFRDGSTNMKLNIGMILDHKEIVDTDTADMGEVSNSLERLPARTESIAGMQRSVAYAQRVERQRMERERRLRPPEPCSSADQLTVAASRPMRPPFRTIPSCTSATTCACMKPRCGNVYYDTRLI